MPSLTTVKETLAQYRALIEARKAGRDVDLLPTLKQLADLSKNPPPDAPPRLRHYLESQSYNKAWECVSAEA